MGIADEDFMMWYVEGKRSLRIPEFDTTENPEARGRRQSLRVKKAEIS